MRFSQNTATGNDRERHGGESSGVRDNLYFHGLALRGLGIAAGEGGTYAGQLTGLTAVTAVLREEMPPAQTLLHTLNKGGSEASFAAWGANALLTQTAADGLPGEFSSLLETFRNGQPTAGDEPVLLADAGGGTASDAGDGLLLAAAKAKGKQPAGKTPAGKTAGADDPATILNKAESDIKKFELRKGKAVTDTLTRLLKLDPNDPRLSKEQRDKLIFFQQNVPLLNTFTSRPSGDSQSADRRQQTDPRSLWEKMKANANTPQRKEYLKNMKDYIFTEENMKEWMQMKRDAYTGAYQSKRAALEKDENFTAGKYNEAEVFAKVDDVMDLHKHSQDAPSEKSWNRYKNDPAKEQLLGDVEENALMRDKARLPLLEKGAAAYAKNHEAETRTLLAERNEPYVAENWKKTGVVEWKIQKLPFPRVRESRRSGSQTPELARPHVHRHDGGGKRRQTHGDISGRGARPHAGHAHHHEGTGEMRSGQVWQIRERKRRSRQHAPSRGPQNRRRSRHGGLENVHGPLQRRPGKSPDRL